MAGELTSSFNKSLSERLDVDFALQAAGLGVWELDPITNQAAWNDQCRQLFGLAKDNKLPYDLAIQYIHPDDVERVNRAVKWAMNPASDGVYDQTYRTIGADDGQLRWVQFRGRSYFTPAGELFRFAGIAQEVTQQILAQRQKEDSQRQLLTLFEQSPVAIATLSAAEDLVFQSANRFYGELVGRPPQDLVGKPLLQALPEINGQGFDQLLHNVVATGVPFIATEVAVDLLREGQLTTRYVDLIYQPRKGDTGKTEGILVVATDVTQQVVSRQTIEESESKLRAILDTAPAGIGVFVGRDLVIENPNQTFIDIVGKGPDIVGLPLREAMPELITEGQPFLQILDDVFTKGEAFFSPGSLVKIVQNGVLQDNYYNISYSPIRNATGEVYAILDIAIDVTAQITVQQALTESQNRLTLLQDTVPAMIFYLDEQQRYQSYNQTFMDWFGVSPTQIIGQSVREFVGERAYEKVAAHLAVAYAGQQERYEMLSPTRMGDPRWLSIIYTPHLDQAGLVQGVIVLATDITLTKRAEEALRESEAALQSAINVADLGTWTVVIESGFTELSARHAEMFGLETTSVSYEQALAIVHPDDYGRVGAAFAAAVQPDSDGRYEAEYRIINARTGAEQHIRARGQTNYDLQGHPISITGITQDITLERQSQLLLETQVRLRTQELELANQDLKRSNDNLQQFAYVASHDLQEPLRKIQSFSTLISEKLHGRLDESTQMYLERITAAGARMSTLIKDLLSYSRISTRQQAFGAVSLGAIIDGVLTVLDWEIQQSGALIQVDELPTINGDESQLNQLFQNLLTNALKFVPPGQVPRIHIQYVHRSFSELPANVRPGQPVPFYHQINVSDQGVGFDMKFLDRIFQVFQRLHGKNEFAGTGVGLAICQRVVENHGGAITATSQPDQGATFCVYLPDYGPLISLTY